MISQIESTNEKVLNINPAHKGPMMTSVVNQPNLTEGLSLIGWRLKRDAEIQARKDEANFECEVEPSSTSYAAFEQMSATDDNYDPYSGINLDLCLEVDAIDLNESSQQTNDDYDPYEVFMRINTRRTMVNRDRAPLALLPSQSITSSTLAYNFADDDTPVKYPLAIGFVDRRLKQQTIIPRPNNKRVTFRQTVDEDVPSRRSSNQHFHANNDLDDDIAPTVTEMDMLEDEEDNEPITKSFSSPNKNFPEDNRFQSTMKRSNNLHDEQYQTTKRYRFDEYDRIPARRGRPPSQEDPSRKYSRILTQFEEQHGLKLGDIRVFAPKLRLRISSVNVNWINLPSIPNFPNKVHQS